MNNMTQYERFSIERKQLQRNNKAPEWYTTSGYQLLKQKNYFLPGETPRGMYSRIANRAAYIANEVFNIPLPTTWGYNSWNDAFFDIMWKGYMSPSTPILTNMGNDRGHPIACSGGIIPDSVAGFYEYYKEVAQLTQRGYGTSAALDLIRARGESISRGGEASGVHPVMDDLVTVCKKVSQGNSRRGSIGKYLDILSSDFDEIADQILADDDGWNVGWNITDDFLELIKKDPNEADRRWKKALRVKLIKGKGYFLFLDKVNRANPKWYKDQGYRVHGSNLCVTGDTKILTKEFGYVPIESLNGTTTTIWDGKEYVDTPIFQTSKSQEIMTVSLDNTMTIKATPYHRWYVKDGYKSKPIIKETKDLLPGDKLVKFDLEPIPHGNKELNLAYVNGFHTGDGTMAGNSPRIDLHDNKQLLLNRFSNYRRTSYHKEGRILRLDYSAGILKNKFFIPSNKYSIESRLRWLEGYLDADGTLTNNQGTESIQVASIELEFLQNLFLMLQELGIHSTITKIRDACYIKLPKNDGSNELGDYWCKDTYRLLIAGSELNKLLNLGYSASRVQPTKRHYQREARQFVQVTSVDINEEPAATYCGTNSVNETLMLNGVQTLNCSEIALTATEDQSFTCVLASMNVAKYDEWKDTKAVEIATIFLDTVIEDMLIKAKQESGFEKVIKFTEGWRAIGLGLMGEATYFQEKSFVFGDLQSIMFNQIIIKQLNERTHEVSKWLANEIGEPKFLKGYGERFSHRIAIAPTMSTAVIMGGVSDGINPIIANSYEQDTAGGTVYRINPTLLNLMKERNVYNKTTMKRIAEDQGSVQAEDWLSQHEKDVFRTAFEINQETILKLASDRQKEIDQSQSINLFFPHDVKEEYVSEIHVKALLDPYIKSLYYIRTLNGATKVKIEAPVCEACDG